MKASWTGGLLLALAAGFVAGMLLARQGPTAVGAAREEGAKSVVPAYCVVETEGKNPIVTDNTKNVLYFYTIDPGKKVGDELKLRGSLDLSQVGQPVLKPTTYKQEK
jgi:hypothetical protein